LVQGACRENAKAFQASNRRPVSNATWCSFIALIGGVFACLWSGCAPSRVDSDWRPLANFATSLGGRTAGQHHNALLSARRLNGQVLAAGASWSFNACVGAWVRSEGYVRAPVSYGGVLVLAWGGGVCQTSTTLYNAALLAGLEILERHPHAIAPQYVAPGLDSAVAQGIADLRLRNPYPFPVRLSFRVVGDRLLCEVQAQASAETIARLVPRCELVSERMPTQEPPTVVGFRVQSGRAGVLVRVWRLKRWANRTERELCHETYYAPLPKGVP